eukprot:scaffold164271_cov20-Tisochrysis_lutea.AAC.3
MQCAQSLGARRLRRLEVEQPVAQLLRRCHVAPCRAFRHGVQRVAAWFGFTWRIIPASGRISATFSELARERFAGIVGAPAGVGQAARCRRRLWVARGIVEERAEADASG